MQKKYLYRQNWNPTAHVGVALAPAPCFLFGTLLLPRRGVDGV